MAGKGKKGRKEREESLKKRKKLNENNKTFFFLAQKLTKCKVLL